MAESAYAFFMQGSALLKQGNAHSAVIPLERARDLEPHKGSVREALARAYYRTGRHRRAREEFEAAVEIDPTNDYAHFGLALCLERQGQRELARGHAKIAFAMRPGEETYREILARLDPDASRPGIA